MSIGQTSVANQTQAYAGTVAEGAAPTKIDSYVNSESSASIPFGALVIKGTGDKEAKNGATGTPVGIVVASHHYSKNPANLELDSVGLTPKTTMGVLSQGVIFVKLCEASVAPGDAVRFVHTADTGQPYGTWRKTANANNTTLLDSSHARWMDSGGDGDVVRLWVDMLGATVTADT